MYGSALNFSQWLCSGRVKFYPLIALGQQFKKMIFKRAVTASLRCDYIILLLPGVELFFRPNIAISRQLPGKQTFFKNNITATHFILIMSNDDNDNTAGSDFNL